MANDLILTEGFDLEIANGDFVIGESIEQEVVLILKSNQGEWKNDPFLGCNLIQLVNAKSNKTEIEKRVRIQLERDGKDYNSIKNGLSYDG